MNSSRGARSGGRETTLQMLYAVEAVPVRGTENSGGTRVESPIESFDCEQFLRTYWASFEDAETLTTAPPMEVRAFADRALRETVANLALIDERIRRASQNWRLERMTRVDRNIVRLATFELFFMPETPRAVVIDEAVELAKMFGTEESPKFVNGILEKVADDAGRERGDGVQKTRTRRVP